MAAETDIEWSDATWNIITGCSIESPGCIRCYAMTLAGTRLKNHPSRVGLTTQAANGAHVWTGEVRFNEQWLRQPIQWNKPKKIFVCAHGDLFHPNVPTEWIDKVFAVMVLAPQHIYQVLTKRARRAYEYLSDPDVIFRILKAAQKLNGADIQTFSWPLPQVHLGFSAEDQQRAEERAPWILAAPAAVRWVSLEPLIGPINLRSLEYHSLEYRSRTDPSDMPAEMRVNGGRCILNALEGRITWPASHYVSPTIKGKARVIDGELYESAGEARWLDWGVVGAEKCHNARPMDLKWARDIRDNFKAAGVPLFIKQLCEDGRAIDFHAWPEDLRIREYPEARA